MHHNVTGIFLLYPKHKLAFFNMLCRFSRKSLPRYYNKISRYTQHGKNIFFSFSI